jgi:CheY-like chemotaxis protein
VVAAVNFARTHRLRLVVKGGGHSYLCGSNAPDSLLVWCSPWTRSRCTTASSRRLQRSAAAGYICDFLTDLLEAEFAAVMTCERTGSLIETVGFELAIIDVNMPEISGYELAKCAAIRNIPALLSSGHPDADIKIRKSNCPYLAKPYWVTDLTFKVAEATTHADENVRYIKAAFGPKSR